MKKNNFMYMQYFLLSVLSLFLCGKSFSQYPVYHWPDTAGFGTNISRTLNLIGTSTSQHKKKVKVLVYGQSISKQPWDTLVFRNLAQRYPECEFDTIDLAIGAAAAQILINPTDIDVVNFYPDIIIFHVYGANDLTGYLGIIQKVLGKTTAEMAIQTDHFGTVADLDIFVEYGGPDTFPNYDSIKAQLPFADDGFGWSSYMSMDCLPSYAKTYNLELIQNRVEWYKYITEYRSVIPTPAVLTLDSTHLNAWGQYLEANVVIPHLYYKGFPTDPESREQSYVIGKDVDFVNGVLSLKFAGNRAELIPDVPNGNYDSAAINVDGIPPSTYAGIPGYYNHTRANVIPGYDWPWQTMAPMKIGYNTKLIDEEWTITITKVNSEPNRDFNFTVSGSITGPDGSGETTKDFTSNSGRVVILNAWWMGANSNGAEWVYPDATLDTIKPGYTMKWSVVNNFIDTYKPTDIADTTKENSVLLFSGGTNADHTMTITAGPKGTVPIKEIKVYRPPFGRPATALTLSLNTYSLPVASMANSTGKVIITANCTWSLDTLPPWIKVNKNWSNGNDSLIFTAQANSSVSPRSATIIIKTTNVATKTLTINQAGNTTGINYRDLEKAIKLYPIPACNKINLELPDFQKIGNIEIYNHVGQLIKEIKINGELINTIDISDLTSGYYLMKISMEDNVIIKKFIVSK